MCVGADNPAEHPQLAHSPGSEWIAQQLQKAYHGLTATLTPGSNAQLAEPDSLTSAQDVREQQDLSPSEQQHQHALGAASDSRRAGHQCIDRESGLSQLPAALPDSASQTQSVTCSKPESTAPGIGSPARAPLPTDTQGIPSHQKQVQQPQQLQQQQQQPQQLQQQQQQQQSQQLDHQPQQQQPQQLSHQQQQQQLDQQQQPDQQQLQQPQQQQQQQRSSDSEQLPAAGYEGTHSAVEADQLEGVPDRVPAAVALEQPGDSQQTPPENTVTLPEPSEASPPSADAQTDIVRPQVEATQGQEQAEKKKGSPAPVFVPIVVAMDARDHKVLVEEWYSRQMVRATFHHPYMRCLL